MEAGESGAEATGDETAIVRFERERHALFIRQANETIAAQQAAAEWAKFKLAEGRRSASDVASKAAKEAEKATSEAAAAAAAEKQAAIALKLAEEKATIEKKAAEDKAAAEVAKATSEAAKAASEAAKAVVEATAADEKADIDKKAAHARLKVAELEAQLAEEAMLESRTKKRKQDGGKQQAEAIAALEDAIRKASARPEADLSNLATLYVEAKGVTRGHARRTANAIWDDAHRAATKAKAKAAKANDGVFVLATEAVRTDCMVTVGRIGQPSEMKALATGFTHRRIMLSPAGANSISREKREVMHWMRAVGIGNVIYDSRVFGDSPADDRIVKYNRALRACCEYWNFCFNCAQPGHFIVDPDKTRRCTAPAFERWFTSF